MACSIIIPKTLCLHWKGTDLKLIVENDIKKGAYKAPFSFVSAICVYAAILIGPLS